jgi:hypothetical protein
MASASVGFRITYQQYGELRDDLSQMGHGGMLVKVADAAGLELDAPISLELVLPDGTTLAAAGRVLHVFPGVGVAVSVPPELVDEVRRCSAGTDAGAGPAHHERIDGAPAAPRTRTAAATAAPSIDGLSHADKIQVALHGNRDQRNAILRDSNKTLHPYVLKNPQLNADDVLAIAKNAQMTPELLGQIAQRKEWFQRPQIALALARNPKTPPEVGVRALDHVPIESLRQIAKGVGALPHVVAAARKKVLGPR